MRCTDTDLHACSPLPTCCALIQSTAGHRRLIGQVPIRPARPRGRGPVRGGHPAHVRPAAAHGLGACASAGLIEASFRSLAKIDGYRDCPLVALTAGYPAES